MRNNLNFRPPWHPSPLGQRLMCQRRCAQLGASNLSWRLRHRKHGLIDVIVKDWTHCNSEKPRQCGYSEHLNPKGPWISHTQLSYAGTFCYHFVHANSLPTYLVQLWRESVMWMVVNHLPHVSNVSIESFASHLTMQLWCLPNTVHSSSWANLVDLSPDTVLKDLLHLVSKLCSW